MLAKTIAILLRKRHRGALMSGLHLGTPHPVLGAPSLTIN
jgi:hypothetical protein